MRLELSRGTSHKFWEVAREGKHLHLRWGRIGTDGQRLRRSFGSPEAAAQEQGRLVASKRAKGYREVGARAGARGTKVPAAATRARAAKRPAGQARTPAARTSAARRPAQVAETRPQRRVSLMVLSGLGQIGASLDEALAYPERARHVEVGQASPKLRRLRLTKLEILGPPPPWIGELTHLRTLVCGGNLRKLPPSLFTLPHLQNLHLDSSNLERLDGLERLRALENVTFEDTPLADDEDAMAALAARVHGAEVSSLITGLEIARPSPPAPRQRKRLVAQLQADALPAETDLRRVDLSGETFADLHVSHDLRGANLARTTWRRCDFDRARLAGADLTGATFHDCYFLATHGDGGNLARVKASGATFVGCGGSLQLAGADLREARLLDLDPDVALELDRARGKGLVLEASFCSEKEHMISARRADLRGARVRFDVTAGRRAELAKKKAARLAWSTSHLAGAKQDKATQVEYGALDQQAGAPATRAAEPTTDPKRKAAAILGTLYAPNASLWIIAADAAVAAGWRGSVDEHDARDDFQRALAAKDGAITIGGKQGALVHVGYRSGWSHVFAVPHGICLLDASPQLEDRKQRDQALALRVAQWKLTVKPRRVAKLVCHTGVLALLLPFCPGAFSERDLASARAGRVVTDEEPHRMLVPMPMGPGIYRVERYPFRPERGRGDYEDEAGDYGDAVSITYADRVPKNYRA